MTAMYAWRRWFVGLLISGLRVLALSDMQHRWSGRLVMGLIFSALAIGAGFTAQAGAAVYWGNASAVGIANLDGSALRYYKPGLFSIDTHGGVAVSSSHMYWHGMYGIGRAGMDGSSPPEWIATPLPHQSGPSGSGGLAVNDSYVYWGNFQAGTLGRASLDGGGSDNAFITGLEWPCGVAVDPTYIYWTDQMGIGRARLDGSEVDRRFVSLPDEACGVVVDDQHIYWGSSWGRIGRADLDGGNPDSNFITGIGGVRAVATNSTHIYWTDFRDGMAYASIGSANLDGTGVNRDLVTSNGYDITGVAVDTRAATPMPLQSRSIRFGRVRHDKRKGIAILEVFVPEAGELALRAPRLGWKVLKSASSRPLHEGPHRWRLKLWPGGRGRVALRIRRQLLRRGRAPVVLRLRYSEIGKTPTAATKKIVFLRDARHPR